MAAPKKQPLYSVKHSAKMDGGGQLHVPAALLPEEVSGFLPRRTSGGPHIRPRCYREQKNTWPRWGPARTLDNKIKVTSMAKRNFSMRFKVVIKVHV